MYVYMCLKFCLYWFVKPKGFHSQKFENHGLKHSVKANNYLCLHSVPDTVQKKIVFIKLFLSIWVYGFAR